MVAENTRYTSISSGHDVRMRSLTVLAQDPSVRAPGGKALTTTVSIPAERLEPGPKGHRIHVIDYDASSTSLYRSRGDGLDVDSFADVDSISALVDDPQFHQQNVYGIAMATLREFEVALGRPVEWGFDSPAHQLKIAPHAFADANAYYSRDSESLCFGYFSGDSGRTIFTCLSHDIVAHESCHALLDGLRNFYLYPSHVDQAAFHEGFADTVALLSVLKSPELIGLTLSKVADARNLISAAALSDDSLRNSVLFRLAEEFGSELSFVRGDALRHSITLPPSPEYLEMEAYQEPHRRGEILVAAVLGSFLSVWGRRLDPLGRDRHRALSRNVVAEEGATAAAQLLRIVIRAIDYLPPVDMTFADYLSALLTADRRLYPNDQRYHYRDVLRANFGRFGIRPAANKNESGIWDPPPASNPVSYDGLHFDSLRRDPNTAFRFLWENLAALELDPDAFTRVISIRPSSRVSNDGFVLNETMVEYVQTLQLQAYELKGMGIRKPDALSGQTTLRLYGGGTLIFDEFGRLAYHIGTGVRSSRQSARLESLFYRGMFSHERSQLANFASAHRDRMTAYIPSAAEQW